MDMSAYVENEALRDILEQFRCAVNVETDCRKRGAPEYSDEQLAALRERLHDLRELEVAWMTLQDLMQLEQRRENGEMAIVDSANEWTALCERARELFH